MTDNIESAVQQLISKVEASQPLIDGLETQLRDLQKLFDYKEAELQRVSAEKDQLEIAKAQAENRLKELEELLQTKEELLQTKEELLQTKDSETKAALEESESSLLHLQQVQEELEYYFLLNQKKSKMLESFDSLSLRAASLVSKLSIEPKLEE